MRCTNCGTRFTNYLNPEYTLCEDCHNEKLFIKETYNDPPSPYKTERDELIKALLEIYPYPAKTYEKMSNAQLIAMRARKIYTKKKTKTFKGETR